MKRLIPGWQYVAAFERQERGAWHVHLAIHKLPMTLPASNGVKVKSYNIVRAVWRSVVGADNGNVDESRRRKFSSHTTAKIAAYISKYMLKAFADGDDWKNRYSAGGLDAPPPPRRIRGSSMMELIRRVYEELVQEISLPRSERFIVGRNSWGTGGFDGPMDSFYLSTGPASSRHTKEIAHA